MTLFLRDCAVGCPRGRGTGAVAEALFIAKALAIEAWLSIEMMRDGWFCPTANLVHLDERCGDLDYVMEEPRRLEVDHLMSNNFAFGGINTSLILRRF